MEPFADKQVHLLLEQQHRSKLTSDTDISHADTQAYASIFSDEAMCSYRLFNKHQRNVQGNLQAQTMQASIHHQRAVCKGHVHALHKRRRTRHLPLASCVWL